MQVKKCYKDGLKSQFFIVCQDSEHFTEKSSTLSGFIILRSGHSPNNCDLIYQEECHPVPQIQVINVHGSERLAFRDDLTGKSLSED